MWVYVIFFSLQLPFSVLIFRLLLFFVRLNNGPGYRRFFVAVVVVAVVCVVAATTAADAINFHFIEHNSCTNKDWLFNAFGNIFFYFLFFSLFLCWWCSLPVRSFSDGKVALVFITQIVKTNHVRYMKRASNTHKHIGESMMLPILLIINAIWVVFVWVYRKECTYEYTPVYIALRKFGFTPTMKSLFVWPLYEAGQKSYFNGWPIRKFDCKCHSMVLDKYIVALMLWINHFCWLLVN